MSRISSDHLNNHSLEGTFDTLLDEISAWGDQYSLDTLSEFTDKLVELNARVNSERLKLLSQKLDRQELINDEETKSILFHLLEFEKIIYFMQEGELESARDILGRINFELLVEFDPSIEKLQKECEQFLEGQGALPVTLVKPKPAEIFYTPEFLADLENLLFDAVEKRSFKETYYHFKKVNPEILSSDLKVFWSYLAALFEVFEQHKKATPEKTAALEKIVLDAIEGIRYYLPDEAPQHWAQIKIANELQLLSYYGEAQPVAVMLLSVRELIEELLVRTDRGQSDKNFQELLAVLLEKINLNPEEWELRARLRRDFPGIKHDLWQVKVNSLPALIDFFRYEYGVRLLNQNKLGAAIQQFKKIDVSKKGSLYLAAYQTNNWHLWKACSSIHALIREQEMHGKSGLTKLELLINNVLVTDAGLRDSESYGQWAKRLFKEAADEETQEKAPLNLLFDSRPFIPAVVDHQPPSKAEPKSKYSGPKSKPIPIGKPSVVEASTEAAPVQSSLPKTEANKPSSPEKSPAENLPASKLCIGGILTTASRHLPKRDAIPLDFLVKVINEYHQDKGWQRKYLSCLPIRKSATTTIAHLDLLCEAVQQHPLNSGNSPVFVGVDRIQEILQLSDARQKDRNMKCVRRGEHKAARYTFFEKASELKEDEVKKLSATEKAIYKLATYTPPENNR